jgi:cell wall-associated NlpC family hydrolase
VRKLRFNRLLVVGATVFSLATAGTVIAPAFAVPDFPSWSEVQAAKRNVAKKKAVIIKLEAYIVDISKQADALNKVALIKGEAYNQAKDEVDAMAVKVNSLQGQADAANAQAVRAKMQLGQLAAQMMRNGSGNTSLNLFLNSSKADDLLYQLGAQDKVAQQADTIYKRSVERQKYAQSLTDELAAAKKQLSAKAKVAASALAEAQSASSAAQAKVDENVTLNKTFYAQLADLKNTSADLERQRAEGLAAIRRQEQGSAAPPAPELYSVGDANVDKVSTMFNFARKQLGERYVLGGMGPNVWDCSGITKAGYAAAGIFIGTHSATNQFNTMAAQRKLIPLAQLQPGDLMWYSQESAFNGDKYHVVIFVGGGLMLEAPNPAAVVRIVPVRYGELFPYAGRPSA